ncbi:unnamed protein product [Leuciscus chuanchicus]
MVPIQTIERDGFRHVVHTLDSRYELPGRNFFSQKCLPELYTEVRDRVMNEIRHLEAYSATTDLWSSRTTEPYISLTIHFIDDDWKLRSRCLQTAFFPEDHTGAIIALGLKDALSAWGLDEARLVCMTTDSGANMVRALEINKWTRLACFGHRLHNAIERSVQHDARVARATGMCKKVVSTFSYSWKKKNALTSAQRELNLPPHKLITESPTRWGSRFKMMERVLEQEKAITQVLAADQKSRHLLPTWQDIDVLEAITKALKPLQDFTDALSGEEYVSVSYVKPVLHLLNTNILKPEEDKAGLCEDIKKRVLDYLNEKYKDPATDELLNMATFLDPRFKTTYMSPEKLEEVRSRVATETKALEEKTATDASSTEDQSERETSTVQLKKPKHSLGSFFKKCSSAPPKQQGIDMELDGYLLMVTADSDSDPLEWWRLQCSHFPRISRLAKKYLCIPATSSPSERAFSTGGNIKEYFEDLLNPTVSSIEEAEAEGSEVDSSITQAEVTEAVKKLLGGKAPGVDEIRPEYLKSMDVVGLSWLTRLCSIAWRSGTVPLDWQTGVVVPLYKKGDWRVCSNYRGITLLSLPGKVYARILERRTRPIVEPWIQEEQCGFRPGRGTLDQLYTLSRDLEGSWEFAQPIHMCFVDLEKVFDRVPRGVLWRVLWEYGVRGPLLRAIRSLYDRSRSLVRIAGSKSDLFPVHVGLRQGCPLSPVLFIIFMDRISRRSQGPEGVRFGDHTISSLLFADDVVVLAPSNRDLQHGLGRFAAECEAAGMRISTSKSEAMVLSRKRVAFPLQVGGEFLPQVEEFKYFGVLFTSEGRMEQEIDRQISAASAVMQSIYRSIYVPTLTYGHELWVMTERTRSRIQAAEMSFLRTVAGRSLRDRVRSSVTREELRAEPLLLHIMRDQLRWLWHLFRMPPGRLPGKVFRACPKAGSPGEDLGHAGWTMSPGWPGNASGSPRKSWRKCLGRGKSGHPCLDCCPCNPAPDKRKKMDG